MATEKRLIDANELLRIYKKWIPQLILPQDQKDKEAIETCIKVLEDQPTVDAVEVVHGYWDDTGRYQFPSGKKAIRCNICGCALSEGEYHLFNWNYCPVCGAKMDMEVDK